MERSLLKVVLLWTLWLQCLLCAPPGENYLNRDLNFLDKYDWPETGYAMIANHFDIPGGVYTDQEARDFVAHGFAYYERMLTSSKQHIGTLGEDRKSISSSVVYGTDDAIGPMIKTRWRWLPLIRAFGGNGEPIYHTTVWSNGVVTKSMDLLRIDYFYWDGLRIPLPSAIVRPVTHNGGFGRGVQFETVYEYRSSFARYMRNPTPNVALQIHDAVRSDARRWTSLISTKAREQLQTTYDLLNVRRIHEKMRAMLQRPIVLNSLRLDMKAGEDIEDESEHIDHPDLQHVHREVNYFDDALAGLHLPQTRPSAFQPWADIRMHEGASSSNSDANTVLRLGRGDTESSSSNQRHALNPPADHAAGSWLNLRLSPPSTSPEEGMDHITGQRGFARWRE